MDRTRGNLFVKILALIIAAILWIYVMNEQNPPLEASFQVPLQIRNLNAGYVATDLPETVKIKVRGARSVIAVVGAKDIEAYIDLKGAAEGKQLPQVHAVLPPGLDLLEINPDKTALHIEAVTSKKLPVDIKAAGTLTTGIVVSKMVPSVEEIIIQGPKSVIDTVHTLSAAIDISNKNADFTVEVPIVALGRDNKSIEGIEIKPSSITVAVSMTQGLTQKVVDVKPILSGELGAGTIIKRITTEPDKIEITGEAKALNKLESVYTEPIAITGLTKTESREVKLQLGENLAAKRGTVTVRIEIGKASEGTGTKEP